MKPQTNNKDNMYQREKAHAASRTEVIPRPASGGGARVGSGGSQDWLKGETRSLQRSGRSKVEAQARAGLPPCGVKATGSLEREAVTLVH